MDDRRLKRLHQRVIAQDPYPGGVCPTQQKAIAFVTGAMSATEEEKMEEHNFDCSACRAKADRLRSASRWFREHQGELFATLAERAAMAGLEPWASCPSASVLQLVVASAIPETAAGARLRERIDAHLQTCKSCRQAAAQALAALEAETVITLADLRKPAPDAVAELRKMLLVIQAARLVQGAGQRMRARPGYRGQAISAVSAAVIDQQGRLTLDEDGNPSKAEFDVIRAELEGDGRLVLDLTTNDRRFWERPDAAFVVNVALQHENTKLVLPAEKISADGRATVVGTLPASVEIREIPLRVITLTVMKRERS